MIAVKGNSDVHLVGNTIHGGGVAGVLVQGSARIIENQFHGNGPRNGPGPPNFAVWGHEKARVSMVGNQISGWRHAISTSKAESVQVIQNTVRNFSRSAIVINATTGQNKITGNRAMSEDANASCLIIDGKPVEGSDNSIQPSESLPSFSVPSPNVSQGNF